MIEALDELSNAIELATRAHYGQVDKQGEPYIFHPLRVMMTFPKDKPNHRIVAVLHDTIEDSELTLLDLDESGFSDYVINAVKLLTRLPKQDYITYLDDLKQNEISLAVKIADIQDNVSRLNTLYKIDKSEARRLDRKYSDALKFLYRK